MKLVLLIFGSIMASDVLGFIVQGPTGPLVIRLGSSVVLPCHVDQTLPMKRLKVEWTRTDSNNLVHLFIYGESRSEEQHEDYYERAHFFDDHVRDGIFSIRLDNLRIEDIGFYRCKVYSWKDVGETVVNIKDFEHLIVSGSNHPFSAYLGEDVTLTCSVDSHIPPEEISWRKMDKDEEIPVLLFQNNKIQPDYSDERYRDRVELLTDEIPRGNCFLRLKSVRTEDKGVYMCHAKHGRLTANATVVVERLEDLIVAGSNHPISVNVGEDVTLNCSAEKYFPPEEISWTKKDKGGDIVVLVFEKSKSLPAVSRYKDRVEFFTTEIPNGNFSLRLKNVRTEDKGVFMCYVKTEHLTANTTVIIERLGFSILHKIITVLCLTASGSALLFGCIICYRLQNQLTVTCLELGLSYLPNIMMFVAHILWGVSEGFQSEAIACSALYFLRPNMLFRAGICGTQELNEDWMISYEFWSFMEYSFFAAVVYPIVMIVAPVKILHTDFLLGVAGGLCVLLLLLGLFLWFMSRDPCWKNLTTMSDILNGAFIALFTLVLYICFILVSMFLIIEVAVGLVGFLPQYLSWCLSRIGKRNSFDRTDTVTQSHSCLAQKGSWFGLMIVMNAIILCYYTMALDNLKDHMGWTCVVVFLQIQWTLMHLTWYYNDSVCPHSTILYLYGSVGVVLLNSSALMIELILTILNGERTVGDLRIILFPSESIFTLSLLILQIFTLRETYWTDKLAMMVLFIVILVLYNHVYITEGYGQF